MVATKFTGRGGGPGSPRNLMVSIGQVLVGSDYPYNKTIGTIDSRHNLACHPELGFTEAEIKKIMTGNASNLIQQ
jgi:hypothetical protein